MTYIPRGVVVRQTPAYANAFTIIGSGGRSSTLTDTSNGLQFAMTNGTTGYDCRIAVKAISAAPYTYTALIRPLVLDYAQLFGLALRQSSNGAIETFEFSSATTIAAMSWTFHNATANTTANTAHVTYTQANTGGTGLVCPVQVSGGVWMQIQDDNTNRLYRTSTDGINWQTHRSVVRTSYITPDQIGLCIFNSTASSGNLSVVYESLG